ncbi:hypothetical protein C8039_13090 [Halogeometricum sp. wsp3]|nr:hypothetical protein C8039_13090 [Halogeometricum sp. wsp3]
MLPGSDEELQTPDVRYDFRGTFDFAEMLDSRRRFRTETEKLARLSRRGQRRNAAQMQGRQSDGRFRLRRRVSLSLRGTHMQR